MSNIRTNEKADIVVRLTYEKEIPVFDFVNMLGGIADEFDDFIDSSGFKKSTRPKLYIREIYKGSIVAELITIFPDICENIDKLNTMLEFGLIMRELLKAREEEKLERSQIRNREKIIAPLLSDHKAKLTINFENSENIKIELDAVKAKKIHEKDLMIREKLKNKRNQSKVTSAEDPIVKYLNSYEDEVFLDRENPVKLLGADIHEVVLQVEEISFGKKNNWKFRNGEEIITAKIADESFLEEVNKGRIRFGKNDLLKVKLKISQVLVKHKVKNTYEIVKIIKRIELE